MQQTLIIVKTEEQRCDGSNGGASKTADDAIGRVAAFDFDDRVAAAEGVRDVALGDDAVETSQTSLEPL
jgi:hypothetical protein